MIKVEWDNSDERQRKAARKVFEHLREEHFVMRRASDQAEIRHLDEAVNHGFVALPAATPGAKLETEKSPTCVRRHFNKPRLLLDEITIKTNGGSLDVVIPAIFGTCYWAILRFMYTHANRPVAESELCRGVQQIMEECRPHKWLRFVANKSSRWQDRLILNARNLCRIGGTAAYGQRLVDNGHVMRFETVAGHGIFTLSTHLSPEKLAPHKRGRKSK